MRRGRRLAASTVYVSMEAGSGMFFYLMATMSSVYRIVAADLDAFQLVLVGTVLEATTLLFEVPTGVVADTISRRASIITGTFLTGAGFILEGSIAELPAILAAQVLWGIGFTFVSGADVAWITDEVGEHRAARLYVQAAQASQAAALVGIVASAALATVSLGLPIVVGGACFIGLGFFLLATMPEEGFTRAERLPEKRLDFLSTLRGGVASVRGRPLLILILLVAALTGMASEAFDRLWVLHLLNSTALPEIGGFDRVVWFGVIQSGGLLLAILGSEIVKRRVDLTSNVGAARALALMTLSSIVCVVGFAFSGTFAFAVITLWAITLLRETSFPVYTAWLNRGLDPASRATVNSMASQMDALGQVVGGPALGWLAIARSVRAAIVVAGLLRAPALLLFARAIRRDPDRGREGGLASGRGNPS